jgi:hypothetical protein
LRGDGWDWFKRIGFGAAKAFDCGATASHFQTKVGEQSVPEEKEKQGGKRAV